MLYVRVSLFVHYADPAAFLTFQLCCFYFVQFAYFIIICAHWWIRAVPLVHPNHWPRKAVGKEAAAAAFPRSISGVTIRSVVESCLFTTAVGSGTETYAELRPLTALCAIQTKVNCLSCVGHQN
ncbi:hypothetical protein NP493_95g08070 [Ridgeia piscesae]|uniref:Uncharacterized protein n=1 Tax=Ridgeia piscesae TaxID=27915 RepID=A0AAD9UHP1_RIDPI|nr:hypothetical protein NP493_95g08070 [Ridgeia piscesae]